MNIFERISYKIYRIINKPLNLIRLKRLGIHFFPPNYVFFDKFDEQSILVDVGCGHEAEFSEYMISQYGVRAFGVDPTKKHFPLLENLEKLTNGKFHHLPVAVSEQDGIITFNERADSRWKCAYESSLRKR